jgi:hypothetical protein
MHQPGGLYPFAPAICLISQVRYGRVLMNEVRVVVERNDTGAIDVDAALLRIVGELRELARTASPNKARQLLNQARRLEELAESRKEG